jgi:putative membrane-bound dehydrogenase-like protein
VFIDYTVDVVATAALVLYGIYFAVATIGVLLIRRGHGRRRWSGLLLIVAGLVAAGLLTFMSSRYWFEGHQIIGISLRGLGITVGSVILPFGLGVLLAWSLSSWLVRQANAILWLTSLAGVLGLSLGIGTVGTMQLIALSQAQQPKLYEPGSNGIQIEKGFALTAFSQGSLHLPTSLRFGPDGQLYVSDYNGHVWAIPIKDGVAGQPRLFAEGFVEPVGLAWRGSELYVASHGKISVLRDSQGNGRADQIRDIVTSLPTRLYDWHSNNGLAFGPDGRLYFPVGSSSDASPETHKHAASILSVNPDGSDLRVFATGVRNPFTLAFNSVGDLFATDNGPDNFTNTPPDKLNYIVEGADYGFPRYFDAPPPGSGTRGPIAQFPPHASADGLAFYEAAQFPKEYRDNAFVVTFHRGEVYRVQLAKTPSGDYSANTSMFVKGLVQPLDITVGPDGSLYIADWGASAIYRISYPSTNTLVH